MFILTMGLNHHTAPIDIREKLVFKESEEEMALVTLQQEKVSSKMLLFQRAIEQKLLRLLIKYIQVDIT